MTVDRHATAVARSLALADESAALGDTRDALEWLMAVEGIGDRLSHTYLHMRNDWERALIRDGGHVPQRRIP